MQLPPRAPLRGEAKLRAALVAFDVRVSGRIALDVGSAAGGFVRVLLAEGAARIYAVDAGFGQLLGSLRQHPRVVNLEATNVAELDATLIPECIDLVTVDVSYLSLASAVRQLGGVCKTSGADLIGLVKPMFELRLASAPTDAESAELAAARAAAGVADAGWVVESTAPSPVTGARGAVEMLLHACWPERAGPPV